MLTISLSYLIFRIWKSSKMGTFIALTPEEEDSLFVCLFGTDV